MRPEKEHVNHTCKKKKKKKKILNVRKGTVWQMRPTKTQISLRILNLRWAHMSIPTFSDIADQW